MKSSPKTSLRVTTVGTLTASAVLLGGGPALAHVSVDPGQAVQGGYSTVNFKVPNERDDASTVRLQVSLPADHPLSSVMPQPVPGWDVKVTTSRLDKPITSHGRKLDEAVTRITWSGGEVRPGQFQQFPVSLGQLPEDTDHLVFKALQTYDTGEVVRWIEEPKEGAPEPEHPAPVLQLTAADGAKEGGHRHGNEGGDHPSGSASDSHDTEHAGSAADAGSGSGGTTDTTARVLGVAGLVAGAVGAAGAAFGIRAARRRSV